MDEQRILAIDLLNKFTKLKESDIRNMEAEAWKHQEKYSILIRRILGGMTLEESLLELEPIEKEELEELVAEGDLQCGKCKSRKIKRVSVQTRSADESETVYFSRFTFPTL